jgi:ferrous iron transport protein B
MTQPTATQEGDRTPAAARVVQVVLCGNPNCGKTTLFNALTGLRAKVGNYSGVTVERKEGRLLRAPADSVVTILDLPGTYSLSPQSLDEQIARDVLLHRLADVAAPDLVVVVVDASNLQRNLYFATQVIELGYPTLVALNMIDVAQENGHAIDAAKLSRELGAEVFPLVSSRGEGVEALRQAIVAKSGRPVEDSAARRFAEFPPLLAAEIDALAGELRLHFGRRQFQPHAEALLLICDEKFLPLSGGLYPPPIRARIEAARVRLDTAGVDWRSAAIEGRYARIAAIQEAATTETVTAKENLSDRIDRVVTHKVWGTLIFIGIMALMFQSIFTIAQWPMNMLESSVEWFGGVVGRLLGEGALHSLLVDGVIAGVGAVVVFLPQICLLFFFIGLLEDTGYMARAAFLMDRLMSKVGLHGKSFIPMLSSFACAIPGIMATRTIESPKDRLVTILVAPLMSCSARLPVYTLLIAACIPPKRFAGIFGLQGLTMLAMYLLGIVVALAMAWLFKKTLLKGPTPMLILELPPYKHPLPRTVLRHMWDRSKLFLRRAGTVILGINILLWFLATYPKSEAIEREFAVKRQAASATPAPGPDAKEFEAGRAARLAALDNEEAGEKLRHSFAGRGGKLLEPLIAPLGFDWKIGIGIVSSFAAREVFVSTMSLVYNVGKGDDSDQAGLTLAQTLREERRADGTPVYTTLVGVTLMVFYVFALQCVSTIVIVRRETNSWKWPLFQWLYMGALAWVLAFLTYQGGRLLGFE